MTEKRIRGAVERASVVTMQVDGREVSAYAGESVAAALLAAGVIRLGRSPRTNAPRGAFCFMGACQECVVRIGGVPVQACMAPVRHGMIIELGRT